MERNIHFDYFGTRESQQFSFYRIPTVLFIDPVFKELSVDAKLLYGILLDRMGLSAKSGWVDEEDHIYIFFVNTEIQDYMQCGHSKATKMLQELEEIGLIRRKRQGRGKPDRIYVMNFISVKTDDNEHAENKHAENQMSEKKASRPLKNSSPECLKSAPIYTDNNQTDMNHTDIFPPSPPGGNRDPPDEYETAKMVLRGKWGYVSLIDSYPRETIDNLILLGADILCSERATIRVGKESLPAQRVKDRLLSLNMTHIDYVLETFFRSSTQIYNTKAYLLTALYNAPTTIDAYYTALFHRNEGK